MSTFKARLMMSGIVLAALGTSATAQDRTLDEIIVTATKRAENLQKVPIAVTAFNAEIIQDAGIGDVLDVANLTPTLTVATSRNPFQNRVAIRGLGTAQNDPSLEPSVGIFVDGVFLGRSGLGMSDLTDIERIEVLQGPQGTLYGKNTNAGAISIITKRPNLEEFEGYIEGSIGDYNLRKFTAALSGPLSENIAYRISGSIHQRDGFFENVGSGSDLGDADDWNVQGKLLWEPNEKLSFLLNGSHVERDTNGSGFDSTFSPIVQAQLMAQGFTVPENDPFDFDIANNTQGEFDMQADNLSLHVNLDTDWGTITSISAWNDYDYFSKSDPDGSELDIIRSNGEPYSGDSLSQELRLDSSIGGNIDYQIGLFYLDQRTQRGDDGVVINEIGNDFVTIAGPLFLGPNAVLDPPGPAGPFRLLDFAARPGDSIGGKNVWDTETFAIFGQATWNLTNDLRLTGGLRWTDEEKEADLLTVTSSTATGVPAPLQGVVPPSLVNFLSVPFVNQLTTPIDAEFERSNKSTDWLIKGAYDLNEDSMIYASVSTGTKSGNFNGVNGAANSREFEDEHTTSYEVGLKSELANSTVRLNAAAFLTDVEDFQFQFALPTGGSTISNEGEVEFSGVDVSLQAVPVNFLTLDAGLLHMNKYEVTAGPNTGKEVALVADWSGNVAATLLFPLSNGRVYLRGDYVFMGNHWVTNRDSRVEATDRHNRTILNARLGWRNDKLNFSIWGKNLTDDEYPSTTNAIQSFSGNQAYVLAPPRTFGATLRYDF